MNTFLRALPSSVTMVAVAAFALMPTTATHAQLRVDPTPATLIASIGDDGEVQLEMPVGVMRFPDGTIAVADGARQSVSYFDSTGRHIRTAGRQGGGPGEFNGLSWAGKCGNESITAWDRSNNRLTVFDSRGELTGESSLRLEPAIASRTAFTTCARNGDMVFVSLPTQMDPGSPVQRAESVVTLLPAEGTARQLGSGISSSEFVVLGGGGTPRPLGLTTTAALAGGRVYLGTGDSAAVLVYSVSGEAEGSIPMSGATRRVARPGQYEAAVEQILQMVPSGAVPLVHSTLMGMPHVTRLPAYSSVHTDPHGNVWVTRSAPGEATRLFAAGADGRTIGHVDLPQQVHVWEVGDDFILGHYTNDMGEPFVASYRLHR